MKFFKELLKRVFVKTEPPKPIDEQLVLFLQATWCQKQLDDFLLLNHSVQNSLKSQPFNPLFLQKRDKIHHDINKLQPIVLESGLACAALIEKKYGVQFCLLSGKDRPAPKVAPTEQEMKTAPPGFDRKTGKTIILPGQ